MGTPRALWADVFAQIIDDAHLVTGDQLSGMVDEAVRSLGLTAEVLVVDLAQGVLTPVRPQPGRPVEVEGTLAGRAYQLGEIFGGTGAAGERVLWVPMLDGTDRAGVLRIGLAAGVVDDLDLRRRCWALSGLLGHILVAKAAL